MKFLTFGFLFFILFSNYLVGSNYYNDSIKATKLSRVADTLVLKSDFDNAIIHFEGAAYYFKRLNLIEKYLEQFSGILYCLSIQRKTDRYLNYIRDIKPFIGNSEAAIWSYYSPLVSIYRVRGNYKKSIHYCHKALAILEGFDKKERDSLIELYNGLAMSFSHIKDYESSLKYYKIVINLLESENKNNSYVLSRTYKLIASVYLKMNNYVESLNYLDKAQQTLQNSTYMLKESLNEIIKDNLILVLIKHKKYNEAFNHLNKQFQNRNKYTNDLSLTRNYGRYYEGVKNYSKSKIYYDKSLQIARKKYKIKHRSLGSIYQDFATFYLEQDSTHKALNLYQKGITALVYDFNDTTNIYKNPNLNKILAENVLLTIFEKKAIALNRSYEQEGDEKALESALEVYGKADSLVARIRQNIQTEGSKQFLAETSLPVYEGAIATALRLYEVTQDAKYQEQAFLFAEKNKATVLLEAIKENEAKDMYLPDSLLEKETDLKVDIAYIEKKLYKEESKKTKMDSSKVKDYQNELFDLNREYEAFQKKIETDFPDYFALKYNEYTPSVSDIQKNLNDNSAFVEYFMGDSILYTFAITKNDFQVYESERSKEFEEVVRDYRKGLTDYRFFLDSTEVAQKLYLESAYQLYDWTLKETCSDFAENINQLVIVPDDLLSFVNFETLVKDDKSDFNNLENFLIQDYAISYAYSGRHLFEKKIDENKLANADLAYGGFAPIYESDELMAENEGEEDATEVAIRDFKTRGGYVDLPEAREAVKKIADLLGGKQWVGTEATEQNFKEHVADYNILHLAMHGVTNNDNPLYSKLIFTQTADTLQDDYLNAYELYTMKLNADLTVLSACNTGFGELKKGEGVMSLARAFSYAGCPSLVMSLWSVPSEETANIMYNFYDGLKLGKDKNVALRSAKLDYLQNAISERKHPFFWGGFIPIGDTIPIFEKPTNWTAYLFVGFGALTLIFISLFLINKRRKTI